MTTAAATFELTDLVEAVRAWLETAVRTEADTFPIEVLDAQAPTAPERGYLVLIVPPGDRPDDRPMAGRTRYELKLRVKACGDSPTLVRRLMDRARVAIAGTDTSGQYAVAMDLDGFAVLERESYDDGQVELIDGLWQTDEGASIHVVQAAPPG